MIPPDDRGFTLGDGVFETVLAVAGELVGVEAHLARMAGSAEALGLPSPDLARVRAACAAAARAQAAPRAAVRASWSAGSGGRGLDRPDGAEGRLTVGAAPAPQPEGAARLAWSSVRRNEHSPVSRHKTLSYLDNVLARREARAAGADEALLLNTAGEVAGGAAANLFWVRGDRLYTPALTCGVLAGTARARVVAAARALGVEATEVHAGADAVESADALFLTNALIGLRPAGFSAPPQPQPLHPLVRRLAAASMPQQAVQTTSSLRRGRR